MSGVVDMLLKMLAFRVGSDPEIRRRDNDEDRNITSIQNACTLVAQRILSRIVQYPVLNGIVATRTIDWGEGKGVSGLDVMFALLCLRLRLPQIRESKDESETDSIERLVNGSCDSMSRADCIMCIDVAAAISSMIGTSEKVVEVRDILESQVLPVARTWTRLGLTNKQVLMLALRILTRKHLSDRFEHEVSSAALWIGTAVLRLQLSNLLSHDRCNQEIAVRDVVRIVDFSEWRGREAIVVKKMSRHTVKIRLIGSTCLSPFLSNSKT